MSLPRPGVGVMLHMLCNRGGAESQFLMIRTSLGVFTVVNYNEHNGYYGGFALRATISQGEDDVSKKRD